MDMARVDDTEEHTRSMAVCGCCGHRAVGSAILDTGTAPDDG